MTPLKTTTAWRTAALQALVATAAGLLAGALIGPLWLWLGSALLTAIAWQLAHLYRLEQWLGSQRFEQLPASLGSWRGMFEIISRRQRQARLRYRQLAKIMAELRHASKALPDGLVVLDQNRHIRWFNAAAQDLLGLRRQDDLDRPLTHLLRNPQLPTWLASVDQSEDIIIPGPADHAVALRLRLFQYARQRWLIVIRDVTEIQRNEAMRKDFVANVSHELRTPLTVMCGYLETMHMECDPEWRPVVDRVEDQGARMRIIIEDLLTLSRLDASLKLEDDAEVAIEPLLNSLTADGQILSKGRHRLRLDIRSRQNLRGSAEDLRSAFINLISNAVHYTPEGGQIEISWRPTQNGAAFAVKDNGPGISAQHLPRLTERFYRVSVDRSRASGGTGLGLAIVKHVLALHQGRLSIDSEPGRGSEFICHFPAERLIPSLPALAKAK